MFISWPAREKPQFDSEDIQFKTLYWFEISLYKISV